MRLKLERRLSAATVRSWGAQAAGTAHCPGEVAMKLPHRPANKLSALPTLGAALLAGCSSITGLDGSSQYACKAPEGVKCDSVSGNYYNALQNNLPAQRKPTGSTNPSSLTDPQSPSCWSGALGAPARIRNAHRDRGCCPVPRDPPTWQRRCGRDHAC
jgi:hypothetical protein